MMYPIALVTDPLAVQAMAASTVVYHFVEPAYSIALNIFNTVPNHVSVFQV